MKFSVIAIYCVLMCSHFYHVFSVCRFERMESVAKCTKVLFPTCSSLSLTIPSFCAGWSTSMILSCLILNGCSIVFIASYHVVSVFPFTKNISRNRFGHRSEPVISGESPFFNQVIIQESRKMIRASQRKRRPVDLSNFYVDSFSDSSEPHVRAPPRPPPQHPAKRHATALRSEDLTRDDNCRQVHSYGNLT